MRNCRESGIPEQRWELIFLEVENSGTVKLCEMCLGFLIRVESF